MRRNNVIVSILVFLIIIVASLFLVKLQEEKALELPYTIGSPIIPSTDMPLGMVMKTFEVPSTEPTPTIAFDASKDSMGGWDIHVTTTNFTFTPEHLNGVPVAGEGHAHLYIDNNLIIMLGPWYHIDSLSPGVHTIRAGLFNNDHSAYSINGTHIEAQQQINTSSLMAGMKM
jgi:hypothetical protein